MQLYFLFFFFYKDMLYALCYMLLSLVLWYLENHLSVSVYRKLKCLFVLRCCWARKRWGQRWGWRQWVLWCHGRSPRVYHCTCGPPVSQVGIFPFSCLYRITSHGVIWGIYPRLCVWVVFVFIYLYHFLVSHSSM